VETTGESIAPNFADPVLAQDGSEFGHHGAGNETRLALTHKVEHHDAIFGFFVRDC
jgi:hypothetical protein